VALAADHQIIALTMEAGTIHSIYWYAHWTPAIATPTVPTRKPVLRIEMDGSITRFVTGPSGGYDIPVGRRPIGARSMH